MGHGGNSKDIVYALLGERLSKMPVGTPVNEHLIELLTKLYTETEAMVGSKFQFVPLKLDAISGIAGIKEETLAKILDDMANKGLVVDMPRRDGTYYALSPMVIGFYEFTFMRTGEDVSLKELAELFQKYFMQTPELMMEQAGMKDKLARTYVLEKVIPAALETEVLTYERVSDIIRQSGGGALTKCTCRHKAIHLGKPCPINAPMDVCTALGEVAHYLVRRGMAKPATVDKLLRVLDHTAELGLVHMGDNVLNDPWFICHCCGCCCGLLLPTKKFGLFKTQPSNFIAAVDTDECIGCGICAESCHVDAIVMSETDGKTVAEIQQKCLGCGVCAAKCPRGAITMSRRSEIYVPPVDSTDQFTRIARERDRMYFKLSPF